MSKIKELLKEASDGVLTDETLDAIQGAFDAAVNETVETQLKDKVSIHVEKALTEQDEAHASKLEKLLEAVDNDHTAKLHKVVNAINENHTGKLKQVIARYKKVINEEANGFKDSMVKNVSQYIQKYIDEKIPTQQIAEAVKNNKAEKLLEQVRKLLGVDMALAQKSISGAVLEGKKQIDTGKEQIETLNEENDKLKKQLVKAQSKLTLNEKVVGLPKDKAAYVKKVLTGKSVKFINENFDYTLALYETAEDQRLENYKREAAGSISKADVINEKKDDNQPVINEQQDNTTSRNMETYLSGLK